MIKRNKSVLMLVYLLCGILILSCTACETAPEQEYEDTTDTQNRLEQNYQDALADKNRLDYLISEYDRMQILIDSLPKGSLEREQAIADSNALVRQIVNEYPELEDDVYIE